MFEDRSLRIVASSILWSTALILISVAMHGRLYGVDLASENIGYMKSLARCIVIGSFVGIPLGILLNAGPKPFRRNVGAAVGAVLGIYLTPMFSDMTSGWTAEAWQRCLPFVYLLCLASGIGVHVYDNFKKNGPIRGQN